MVIINGYYSGTSVVYVRQLCPHSTLSTFSIPYFSRIFKMCILLENFVLCSYFYFE